MDERSQTWFTLLEESSEWNENSNASQGTTSLATSTFITSAQKQKDLPLLSRVLFNSCGQILSPIKSTNPEPVQTFEKTGNLTQYTIESTDESAINTSQSNANSILQKPTKTRNSLTLNTSRPPNFNEHLNDQNNSNCSNNELGATANDVPLQGSGSNPLTKEPTSLQFPYPTAKSMQMQIASFEMKLSNLHGDTTDLLNLSPNHRNSLPSLFDPVLLVRTEPVGQDLSKSHRSLSAPISTAKVNEITNQTMVSHKVKDDITSSLDPIIIGSLANQKIQYQIKDDHLDGNNEIPINATDATRSIASSTNATGCASNFFSVTDYMSVNDRLKLLPLTSNTVKDNEKIDENLVDAQEDTGSLFPLESYGESRDRFLLLEGRGNSNTAFSASSKVSMTHRSVFDPCIRENSAPVGSESNVQSLTPGAVHLSFSDSDEELTNNQTLKIDFDYSLPIAEQERLLPTGADSEFLEREAKNGRITKSKYFYRVKNKRSDLESDQPENISEEVNNAQLLNVDSSLYSTNTNRYATTAEHELIEAKVFERLTPDIQDSSDDASISVDKSNTIFQSLDSLNVNNHATFNDIKHLTKSFATISNQVDQIKASFDLNNQILKSRSSNELEKEDCVTKRFLQNSVPLERGLNDTSERFIYGSESSSFQTSTNLTQQNPSNLGGNNFSEESSVLNSASHLRQPKSSSTSLLQPKDSSGNVDTEEDDTDELIRMASKLVESYSKDISEDSNQTQSSYSSHSAVNTDTSKQAHAVSREKNGSRLSNILTESGRGTMPSSEGIVTPPQTNSTNFQNINSSYNYKHGEISPSKKECCKQNENATSVDLSNSFLEANLASRNHSSNSAHQEKASEVFPNKTNYKHKRLISTSAATSENFPYITLSSSSSSSKDYTTQYDSNSSRLFDYDISQDSDSLGRQVNNLLSRTAYLESKTSSSDHFKSDVLHRSSHDKHTSSFLYANTSINPNKNSEITDAASAKSEHTSFSQLKQDLIDLQHDLNENLSIEKKQLGISDNWSPLKNLSIEDSFTHSDKDLIDFNERRLPIEDNYSSSGLMPNSELSKFDFKNLSPSEKNTSLSLPLPLVNAKDEKKTFESLQISLQNEDASLKDFTSFKEFIKCSGSSKNDNQKLQKKSNSTSFSSSQTSNIPNSSSNQIPYNQPLTNDSLELKDDLSLRVERILSKESSYEIPKMSCLQNVRPKEGFFPKASFELNSSSEIETEPRLMEDKSSTVMPKLDKKVANELVIGQTASAVPPEDFDYFDPLPKSNSENKVQNVSKESMKINSLNESLQKPNFNQPLIQGLKAPDNVATSLASKISNVSHLVTSGLHSKSNNDFTGINGKNNNSKPVDLSSKDSLYATGDLKRPEDIIRNQLNSPNSETNEVFQNPTCDSLNSTKFSEDDVRKCLDWSNMTDFDSPSKERCQDTNTKNSTLFLSKSSLSQTFNNNFDMLNQEPFPRSQENNSKNYSLSNSKSNLPNRPAYLSTFKETVPDHSATSEDCVDYEFLKPKASPKMLQHTELNTNDNSSGNITNKILDKYQSPILHRSESFQKSSFLNQSLNDGPSVRPCSSMNRSHSLEEFQKPKISLLPQKRNTYRTKPRNSSETLSSSSDSDSLKRDLHRLSADLEQDYERSVRHSQLTCSLPTRIGMTSEQVSVDVLPKNQYPFSLPTSLNSNRDIFEFNNDREDSQIHSLLSKYELPMKSNVGTNNFSHKNSAHNSITASSGDVLCINSRRSKTASDETGQSNKFEPDNNTVDAVLLDNLTDSEETKVNQESPDMYRSSSCDPRETSSQSKLNPSPSGSDSSTLSQKTWTLRPYKPPGSQDWYYTEASGFPPFSVCDSGTVTTATTTTVESGDTGSDDAIGPHIQKEFLGSRPDGPSIPGIYSRVPGKKKSNTFDNPLLSTIQERSNLNDKEKMKTKTRQEVKESTSYYRETRRNFVDSQDTYSNCDSKKLSESNYPNQVHHITTKVDYVSSDRLESFRKNSSSKEQFDHTKNKGCQRYRNGHDEGIKHKETTVHDKQQDANSYKQLSFESVTTVETPSDFSTDPESATSSSKTMESSQFISHDSDVLVLALAKKEETDKQQAWGDLNMTGQNLSNGEQVIFRSDMHVTYKPTESAKSQLSRKDSYSQRISRSAQELDLLWQKFKQQTTPPSPENSLDSSRLEQIHHLVKNPTQALVRRSINLLEEKRQQQTERAERKLELQKQALLKQKLQDVDDSTQSSVASSAASVCTLSENVEMMSDSYWPEERTNGNIVYSGSRDPMITKLREKIEKQRQRCELMKKRDKASEEKLHKLTKILVTRQMNDLVLASELNSPSMTSTATCMSNSTMESAEQSLSKKIPLYSQYCGKCSTCNEKLFSKPRNSSRLKNPKWPHRVTSTNFNSKNTARSTESKFGTSSLTVANLPSKHNVKGQSTERQPIEDDHHFTATLTVNEVSKKRKPFRKVIPKQDATTMVPSPLTVYDANLYYSASQEDISKVSVAVQTSPLIESDTNYHTATECTPSNSKTSVKTTPPNEIQIAPKSCPVEDLKVIPVPFMWTPKKQKSKNKALHSTDSLYRNQQKKIAEKDTKGETWFVSISETNISRTDHNCRPSSTSNGKRTQRHVRSNSVGVRSNSVGVRKVSKQKERIPVIFNNSFDSHSFSSQSNKSRITLQEAFQNYMPNWISRSRERQKRILLAAHERRYQMQMEMERNKIFQNKKFSTNASENDPICENLYKPKKRAFSKQEMKELNWKLYRNLPEVINEKVEKIRKIQYKCNKTKSRVFSMKVQKNILNKVSKKI